MPGCDPGCLAAHHELVRGGGALVGVGQAGRLKDPRQSKLNRLIERFPGVRELVEDVVPLECERARRRGGTAGRSALEQDLSPGLHRVGCRRRPRQVTVECVDRALDGLLQHGKHQSGLRAEDPIEGLTVSAGPFDDGADLQLEGVLVT